MKEPRNRYRYTLTDFIGTIIVAPLGEAGLKIDWAQVDEDRYDYTKTIPSRITFVGATFARLLSIEKSTTRCDFIFLSVERFCEGAWVPWFDGRFLLNDGVWDEYRCQVEIKLDKTEDDDCLTENKSTEVNLFDLVPDRYAAKLYTGTITIETVTYQINAVVSGGGCPKTNYWAGSGTPEAGGWIAYYNYSSIAYVFVVLHCIRETRWARQKMILPDTDPSPGAEWILLSTGGGVKTWVKPAILFDCKDEELFNTGGVAYSFKHECQILGAGEGINQIDNGMKLGDCLQAFADNFCGGITVKSEFFQINPDSVAIVNYVTSLPSNVRNILVYQKSDVKRPNVSGNATKFLVSWDKFINQLVEAFNVRWRITGTVLRVEHISYFSKNDGLNLTAPRYANNVKGLVKYSYKTEEIPSKEAFQFMEATGGSDFEGLPILYTGGCVSDSRRGTVKTHAADFLTTDVELCLNNPSAKDSIVDDRGMVLIAVDDNGLILSEPPILAASAKLNNVLSWAHLHRDFHKHYRLLKNGILNGVATVFASVKPLKKGVPLTIPFCCDDVFNPDDQVTTALGKGTVEKASFNFKDDTLTLDLLYPSDLTLYDPPIANNDVKTVFSEIPMTLDVLVNDIESPTGGPITIIEIVTPPAHGTASVVAGPNINYTSNVGYFGPDNLVYRIKDAAGIPSNNALVALNVTSQVFVKLVMSDITDTPTTLDCPPVTNVGNRVKGTATLYFYSDSSGTIPLDTTGLGLHIAIKAIGIYDDPGNAPATTISSHLASGTSVVLFTNYAYFISEFNCAGARTFYRNESFSIDPGPYNIIL